MENDVTVYHVWARGVDGRVIFTDPNDHRRFIHALRFFNTTAPVRLSELSEDGMRQEAGEPLIDLIAYTALDNHFHILVSVLKEGGLTTYLRKLGTGYTHYFNKRHGPRRGRLFESRLQYKPIESDIQLFHTIAYVHLNILDRSDKRWRDGILNTPWPHVKDTLVQYPWSSARAYLGGVGDAVINMQAVERLIGVGGRAEHEQYVKGWSTRGLPYSAAIHHEVPVTKYDFV